MVLSSGGSTCLQTPVRAPIDATFEAPACPYCAGRRTVDFAVGIGADVVAAVSGTVSFVGVVAGTGYITIAPSSTGADSTRAVDADDGTSRRYLVTVGGVNPDPDTTSGVYVTAGSRIGTAASAEVRLSVRRIVEGGPAEYLDPEPSLARWRGPIRLIPDPSSSGPPPRTVRRIWSCRRPL